MQTNQKPYKLCFYCENPIIENDKISICSITHSGLRYNISNRHMEKLAVISNTDDYEPDLMHLRGAFYFAIFYTLE